MFWPGSKVEWYKFLLDFHTYVSVCDALPAPFLFLGSSFVMLTLSF